MKPILFLLKRNLIYGSYTSVVAKSGLLNSARITSSQLQKHLSVNTEIEVCFDGNEVDKFLHKHKPKICIIEALWVTPEKLKELTKLHKNVIFIVLMHSETSFLSGEGNAVSWIKKYNDIERVYPAFNSKGTFEQFKALGIYCFYLPNVYLDVEKGKDPLECDKNILHIGCFGAIRPFKNQLLQAIAAILFTEHYDKILHFHMNTSRIEQSGESVYKNIKALFENTPHKFIEHGWMERGEFLCTVSKMDLGLQLSFSESFNIVAADFVHQHVPIVVSPTIHWMPDTAKASTEDMQNILSVMRDSFINRSKMANKNTKALQTYNKEALKQWKHFLLHINTYH